MSRVISCRGYSKTFRPSNRGFLYECITATERRTFIEARHAHECRIRAVWMWWRITFGEPRTPSLQGLFLSWFASWIRWWRVKIYFCCFLSIGFAISFIAWIAFWRCRRVLLVSMRLPRILFSHACLLLPSTDHCIQCICNPCCFSSPLDKLSSRLGWRRRQHFYLIQLWSCRELRCWISVSSISISDHFAVYASLQVRTSRTGLAFFTCDAIFFDLAFELGGIDWVLLFEETLLRWFPFSHPLSWLFLIAYYLSSVPRDHLRCSLMPRFVSL